VLIIANLIPKYCSKFFFKLTSPFQILPHIDFFLSIAKRSRPHVHMPCQKNAISTKGKKRTTRAATALVTEFSYAKVQTLCCSSFLVLDRQHTRKEWRNVEGVEVPVDEQRDLDTTMLHCDNIVALAASSPDSVLPEHTRSTNRANTFALTLSSQTRISST
jgi:hypothetical protein